MCLRLPGRESEQARPALGPPGERRGKPGRPTAPAWCERASAQNAWAAHARRVLTAVQVTKTDKATNIARGAAWTWRPRARWTASGVCVMQVSRSGRIATSFDMSSNSIEFLDIPWATTTAGEPEHPGGNAHGQVRATATSTPRSCRSPAPRERSATNVLVSASRTQTVPFARGGAARLPRSALRSSSKGTVRSERQPGGRRPLSDTLGHAGLVALLEGGVAPPPLPVDAYTGHGGAVAASLDEQPSGGRRPSDIAFVAIAIARDRARGRSVHAIARARSGIVREHHTGNVAGESISGGLAWPASSEPPRRTM